MNTAELLCSFMNRVINDPRIGPVHIALFCAIANIWSARDIAETHIRVFGAELMRRSKICGVATYHKVVRELHEYGYIEYLPSYNRNKASRFRIRES